MKSWKGCLSILLKNLELSAPKLHLHPVPSQAVRIPDSGSTPDLSPFCTPSPTQQRVPVCTARPPFPPRPQERAVLTLFLTAFTFQPSNSRPAHSSADLDPFKFRWLIPISALQVRLGNTAGNFCMLYKCQKETFKETF